MLPLLRFFCVPLLFVCSLSISAFADSVVLFDESHSQQFLVGKSGPLDLSELASLYQANGITVTSDSDALTRESLAPVDVLVLSGPFRPLSKLEMDAVMEFINSGGGLAVMLHIAPPVRGLLHRLDVDYTNGTLRETRDVIGDNPLDFKVTTMAEHPLTAELTSFSVYGAWALRGTAEHVKVLAETSPKGWVDLDRDNKFSSNDAAQSFGVLVAGEIGRGRYVVLGDDALFQNRFFDEGNQQLALELIEWLNPQ